MKTLRIPALLVLTYIILAYIIFNLNQNRMSELTELTPAQMSKCIGGDDTPVPRQGGTYIVNGKAVTLYVFLCD